MPRRKRRYRKASRADSHVNFYLLIIRIIAALLSPYSEIYSGAPRAFPNDALSTSVKHSVQLLATNAVSVSTANRGPSNDYNRPIVFITSNCAGLKKRLLASWFAKAMTVIIAETFFPVGHSKMEKPFALFWKIAIPGKYCLATRRNRVWCKKWHVICMVFDKWNWKW